MKRVFTDIDDTLMSTGRKVPEADRVTTGAVNSDGEPGSFLTSAQAALWDLLSQWGDTVVPVTARSQETFRRVVLPMTTPAVLDFGATILNADGSVDSTWLEHMLTQADGRHDDQMLALLETLVVSKHDSKVKATSRVANGITVFQNFRAVGVSTSNVAAEVRGVLKCLVAPDHYYMHVTDRDVTVLPAFIRKGYAVAHLIETQGWETDTLIGCGDSLSDCDFLAQMDFAVVPGKSRNMHALALLAQEIEEL